MYFITAAGLKANVHTCT